MKLLTRLLDLFLYTSLLTTCCALGLCMATERLVNGSGPQLVSGLHILVVGSTLLVYNTPRIVRKPQGAGAALTFRPWYFVFFFIGALLTSVSLCFMPLQMIVASSVLGAFAFAYFLPLLPFREKKRLRDFGWLKITVLASVWTIATSVLPMLYWQKSISGYPLEILLRLCFIFTLCIIFDLRDMRADQLNNINTLPQKVGVKNSYLLINSTLIAFSVIALLQYSRFHDSERLAGALVTAVVTKLVATYLRRQPSDRAYLLLADGVMLFYSVLVLI